MRSWWLGPVMLALAGAAAAAPVVPPAADDYLPPPPLPVASPITDHFALRAGFFWGSVSTFGRFDSATGVLGTPFTAEHDLGLTDQARQPFVEIMFRLEDRNRLRVDFIDMRRAADRNIDRNVQYGDVLFLVDNPVHSEFDWRQTDLTYTYSFLRGERYELGAGLGIHLLQVDATADIPNTPQYADFSGAGPFATLALDGTWRISQHWALSARGNYLKLNIDGQSGTYGQYHSDVQYRWKRNLAFGVGYEYEDIQLDIRHQDPSGVFKLRFNGPEVFARLSF
ncbi:MAG TPA: hypothetical protein VIH80_05135 [Steroidobacteraceae bacterium]|jgi:hypothetical protein